MSLQRNRTRFSARGLGLIHIRETSPTPATDRTDIGYLAGTDIADVPVTAEIFDERGDLIDVKEQSSITRVTSALQQVGIDEYNLIKNSQGKLYALDYSGIAQENGRWQYWGFDRVRLSRNVLRGFRPGVQTLPLAASVLDLKDELGFDHPLYYVYEGAREIHLQGLQLWVAPHLGHNLATNKLLDISGHGRHGTLTADFATMWQSPYIRFDGANDSLSFGDVLDDDGSGDFIAECWFVVKGADDSLQEILAKKTAPGNSAGWGFFRNASNKLVFQVGSGSAFAEVVSASDVLQDEVHHAQVAVDRDGNLRLYLDGVLDGTPVSVAAIGTGANALNLYAGRDDTNHGQVDVGGIRVYRYAAGSLPTTAEQATMADNHFNGEREFYGV